MNRPQVPEVHLFCFYVIFWDSVEQRISHCNKTNERGKKRKKGGGAARVKNAEIIRKGRIKEKKNCGRERKEDEGKRRQQN